MTGRTRFGPNIIDTENIYDGCVSYAKLSSACQSTLALTNPATLAEAKIADKTVVKYLSVSLYATGTVVYPICTVPSVSTVTRVLTVCEASRVGTTGTIDIGDAGDADGLLATAKIGKTLNDITGDDPADYGVYLWVPGLMGGGDWSVTQGTLSGGDWTYTPGTLSGGDWEVTAVDPSTHAITQTKTAASLGAGSQTKTNTTLSSGSQTKTAATITTYGHKRTKTYLADTVLNATVAKGDNTAGTMGIYVFYDKVVPST